MKNLNYQKLMALKPTQYSEMTNQIDQKIEFVEHPIQGSDHPVIAIFHDLKVAVVTDFYDCGDFYENSDYNPVYLHGDVRSAWEFDL